MYERNKYENLYRWSCHKLQLQEKFERKKQAKSKHSRGSIYSCYLGENIGHEKSRLEARPCLIVSNDGINHSGTNVIIVPLSKHIRYESSDSTKLKYPWHYVLYKEKYHKLNYDSVVQCEDIRCVSKARLGTFITKISKEDLMENKKRLKTTLQI